MHGSGRQETFQLSVLEDIIWGCDCRMLLKRNELYGMLYNNLWVVNFCVDSPGEMNFEFDLTYREGKQSVEQLTDMADSYYIPMSIVNTPEALEDPVVHKYLNTPQRLTSGY